METASFQSVDILLSIEQGNIGNLKWSSTDEKSKRPIQSVEKPKTLRTNYQKERFSP